MQLATGLSRVQVSADVCAVVVAVARAAVRRDCGRRDGTRQDRASDQLPRCSQTEWVAREERRLQVSREHPCVLLTNNSHMLSQLRRPRSRPHRLPHHRHAAVGARVPHVVAVLARRPAPQQRLVCGWTRGIYTTR